MHLSFFSLFPLVAALDWTKPIAVAVSGGGDSVALAHTIAQYRAQLGFDNPIHFLSVDHQLRASSAKDVQFVQRLSEKLGAQFSALSWQGDKPNTGVLDKARNARRELLISRCDELSIEQLLLAHTIDDRLETLIMRVRRGGFRGHSSIPSRSKIGNITLHRPFITASRDQLRAVLSEAGLSWIDDPTNLDENYERVRIRRKLKDLSGAGIDLDQLRRYAVVMGRWRSVIAQEIAQWLHHWAVVKPLNGTILVKFADGKLPPLKIRTEIIRELVRFAGGDNYLVSVAKAEKAAALLWSGDVDRADGAKADAAKADGRGNGKRIFHDDVAGAPARAKAFSIGRCVFYPTEISKKSGRCRSWELKRAERHLPPAVFEPARVQNGTYKWDGRFDISLPAKTRGADNEETPQTCSFDLLGTTPMPTLVEGSITVIYRPAVLDGPINEHDQPIFDILEGKVSQN